MILPSHTENFQLSYSCHLCVLKYTVFLSLLAFFLPPYALCSSTIQVGGNETDRMSLLAFKNMIVDDPSRIMDSWNETIHFCDWPGVSCGRRHRRVTVLDLSSLKLRGTVSPSIGNLSFLHVLELQNNSFSGEIPSELGYLHKLQVLRLDNNSFTGHIPSNISGCFNLFSVVLSYNMLAGIIPAELGTLLKLQQLFLVSNYFTGGIPPSLGNLSTLDNFSASKNNLVGKIPDELCQLSNLKYFVVNENNLSGTLPPCIFNHSSMVAIDVGTNHIEGKLPPLFGITLPNLQFLSIRGNNITGNIPVTLSNATKLEFLVAGRNGLTGKVPPLGNLLNMRRFLVAYNHLGKGEDDDLSFLTTLVNATSLELLELNTNNFGGVLPASVCNLSSELIKLSLSYNQISGKLPRGISNLKKVEALFGAYNRFYGEIPSEIGDLINLQELALLGNQLSGQIPISFGNLASLTRLSLRENNLQGRIPSSLGKCRNLGLLDLGSNNISGFIPSEILEISSLSEGLDLSHNHLTGILQKEIGKLSNLGYLNLSDNKLRGQIPTTLGTCLKLEALDLNNNNFQGSIPSTMNNLRGLELLVLSHNNLSGEIPRFLKDFKFLQVVDLSGNNLEGAVPIGGIFNNVSIVSIKGNKNLCGGIPELDLPACSAEVKKEKKSGFPLKIVIPVVSGLIGLTCIVCFLGIRQLGGSRKAPVTDTHENSTIRVSYQCLLRETDGFSASNLLGMGAFGSVYKGISEDDGIVFAVKVLDLSHHAASRSFLAECEILKNIRHRNLVKVLSACSSIDYEGNEFKAIVYEYMDKGSLEEWLHFRPDQETHEHKKLGFLQRLNIAIDVACALDYLHNDCQPPIIHRDLKPSNILLDENMIGHVGDFGLARFIPPAIHSSSANPKSSTGVGGTIGYTPPELGMGSEASIYGDLYSFGIMLLEMFTGKRPTDEMFKDSLNLHNYAKASLPDRVIHITDPILLQERDQLGKEYKLVNNRNSATDLFLSFLVSVIQIGVACSVESPKERKRISDVVGELNSLRKLFLEQAYWKQQV
ncbi:PREDICTED: probable LRR receptor-like serine/threonine-protein kinase At3g47570 [Nicotiana attenuata]|uniref:non-specific serine/threonine protein kinase n=1 Tax=Nicotiana attenuata TaxID=49451 RepID=A0A1J6IG88_NICAT|nr:PREDICTED: probable LRR receptor-like serine/threonine-protein kinase At3g47570 [Nicotiana attenuata]OIT03666.1 putative lrr receptor-like serinethreonine-protein kinase [Nicotiana attenuata]